MLNKEEKSVIFALEDYINWIKQIKKSSFLRQDLDLMPSKFMKHFQKHQPALM